MPKMEVFYGPGLPYGAREKFPLSKTMATPHRMHCLDRNSSSLLGVRIQSLIRHGSKNPQKPQICRKKWHKNNELGASHSHGLKFPNLSHAQSMNRYPLSCQISSGKMWLKQTNNIKYPCSPTIFHFFPPKKKHHLLWALTSHISRVPLQNLVLMLWFLPGFLAQVEQGGPPARGFGPPAARKPVHAPALMWLLCRTTQGRKEVTAINCWTAPFPSCQTMCDTSCSNKVSDTSNQRRINGWWQCFCIHLGLLNNYRPKIVKLPKSWWNTLKKKQGFPFHSEGLGVEAVFPRRCATAHNHAHLSTTVRVRAVWPCLW